MNNNGKWTQSEHEQFLKGLNMYGNDWHKISTIVTTRTCTQIKTHALKYHATNNAEVQLKYQERLLPDTKTDIQKNDTSAHQYAANLFHARQKPAFRRAILPLTKNAENPFHTIRKPAFRRTILPLTINAEN